VSGTLFLYGEKRVNEGWREFGRWSERGEKVSEK
jgi:hypothetical protein